MLRYAFLGAVAALAACAPNDTVPIPAASLPADAVQGAGDPARNAILSATSALGAAGYGRVPPPAVAARTVANLEFLAVELRYGPRWAGRMSSAILRLETSRAEWRDAFGIAQTATPQQVIDSMFAASRALSAGQQDAAAAALPATVFPAGGQATLARLGAMPKLADTNSALAEISAQMDRLPGSNRSF